MVIKVAIGWFFLPLSQSAPPSEKGLPISSTMEFILVPCESFEEENAVGCGEKMHEEA